MKKILAVRACAVGDFVLNLPALQALQIVHPGARFTLVGYPATLELAREFVAVDAIFSIENSPWSRLFYEALSDLVFDSAIVWMKDPAFADNLRASGISDVLRASPFPQFGHAADHLLRTLRLPAPPLPDFWQPASDEIIVHPGSGSPHKNWPHFEQLASRLSKPKILAGPAEVDGQAYSPPWKGGVAAPSRECCKATETGADGLVSPTHNLSLPEVSSLLRHARAYIGNDSGITHLAAYLGVPTLALFGPTDPRTWGPLGRRSRIIWKTKLEDISVEEVLSYAGRST